MQKLNESDFLTVNIRTLFNNTNDSVESDNNTSEVTSSTPSENASATPSKQQNTTKVDWEKELNRRLVRNRTLSAEAREKEYDIEKRFWYEYFNAEWNKEDAKLLIKLGSRLQNDIKALGFNKKLNPIIAFLHLKYVRTELLQTGLLNSNTYKAISTAVQKKYVADTEFLRVSNYNIIYCPDLYKKSVDDMINYLKCQHSSLRVTNNKYTEETQNKNKRVFLQIIKKQYNTVKELVAKIKEIPDETLSRASLRSKSAKLNSLDVVTKLSGQQIHAGRGEASTENTSYDIAVDELVDKVKDDPAKVLACLQYLSMTTGSEEAQVALANSELTDVPVRDLMKATTQVSKLFSKIDVNKNKAKRVVAQLLK